MIQYDYARLHLVQAFDLLVERHLIVTVVVALCHHQVAAVKNFLFIYFLNDITAVGYISKRFDLFFQIFFLLFSF